MSDGFEPKELQSYGDLYPGRFLRADSSVFAGGKKPVFTIARVLHDELEGDKGKEVKVIVVFDETSQAWVMPKICGTCLVAMFGTDVRAWKGKRVCLFATADLMPMPAKRGSGAKPEPCIRVFGSPDIASDIALEFTPPRRKPILMTLRGPRKAAETQTQPEAPAATETADKGFDQP